MRKEIKEKLRSIVIKQIEEDFKEDYYLTLYDLLDNIHYYKLIKYLNENNTKEFDNFLNKQNEKQNPTINL
jgi:hypothetical protein